MTGRPVVHGNAICSAIQFSPLILSVHHVGANILPWACGQAAGLPCVQSGSSTMPLHYDSPIGAADTCPFYWVISPLCRALRPSSFMVRCGHGM